MTRIPLDIIGAGIGWGAQLHETEDGPRVLKGLGYFPDAWKSMLGPVVSYLPLKKLDYEKRVEQVRGFNQKLALAVSASLENHQFPVVIGGDHSCAIGTWNGAASQVQGDFGLIWIDAHMDAHTTETTPSNAIHGMPVAALLGYGDERLVDLDYKKPVLKPENLVLIGVRNFEEGEATLLKKLNVKIFYMNEVRERGFGLVFEEAVAHLTRKTAGFGVSLDLDAFDPVVAPGVGSPAKDGITSVVAVCEALKKIQGNPQFKAFEITEFNPSLDKNHMTAQIIEDLVMSVTPKITNEWIANEKDHCAPNYCPLPVVLSKGQGVWVWDVDGKRYLDMMSAYSAVSFGHSHPRLIGALTEQAKRLSVTSRAFHTDTLGPFLKKLCEISGFDMCLPMNTGAEAVETAIKAARKWAYEVKKIPDGKAEIIVAANNFHGRTTTIISFSSDNLYKKHFGPLTLGFKEIPFGDVQALKNALTPNTCAFLVEPMQGEAGILIPKSGWLKSCEQVCRENNVLLILDEVQTGLGRTGSLFACDHEGVKPDGLILGKALGGGMLPVSAFLASKELMQVFTPGTHGSTFGGNPLAARVAYEALCVLEDEDLVNKSAVLGEVLLKELKAMNHPLIKEVRGKGLWVAMEMDANKIEARKVCEALMANGILTKETHETVVRFAPPLVITKAILLWSVGVIKKTLDELQD